MWLTKTEIFIIFTVIAFLAGSNLVSATNGCGLGDAECGSIPSDNCDVIQNTTFNSGTYTLPEGIDICTNNIVLDCNGATLTGSTGFLSNGITITSINGSTIKNCVSNKYYSGIYFSYSNFNTLVNSVANQNIDGIYLFSSNNRLINNTANSNIYNGITLYGNNNTLSNNSMSNNSYNFVVRQDFIQMIDTTNTVDSKPIYYVFNGQNTIYDESTNAGFFACIGCNNVTVKNLLLTKNSYGVLFSDTSNSSIINITALNNYIGIYIAGSPYNNVLANNIVNSNDNGIILSGSFHTLISNTVNSNIYRGIGVSQDSVNSSILINNTANSNGIGIGLLDVFPAVFNHNNTLINNTANNNKDHGIWIFGSFNTLTNNNVTSNNFAGITLSGSNNNIMKNTANSNSYGIYIMDYSFVNNLTNNIATSNSKDGIYISGVSFNSHLTNNTVCSNNQYGGDFYDIFNFGLSSSGYNNTCQTTFNWNDAGAKGCTYLCEPICGDANSDKIVNLQDIIYLVNYLFKNGPEPKPFKLIGDANGDLKINLVDIIYLVNFIFKGGPAPVC